MTNILVRHTITVLVAASALAALPGPGHAQFLLYDNFASGVIDPELWSGVSVEGNFDAPTAEFVRVVDTGALRLALTSWGNDLSNSGSTTSRQGLQFRHLGTTGGSQSIIGIKIKLTVLDAVVEDCAANPATGSSIRARAQVIGWFFNDGSSTGASDDTGNIIAGLQLSKEADGTNLIQPFLQKCTNASCGTVDFLPAVAQPAFAMTWSPNTPLILKLRWDRVNGKFKFLVRDQGTQAAENVVIDYLGIVNDAGAPVNGDFKNLRVQNSVKNCSGARKQVFMDALFDNVNVQRAP